MKAKIIFILVSAIIIIGMVSLIVGKHNKKKNLSLSETNISINKDVKNVPHASLSKLLAQAQAAQEKGDYLLAKLKFQELINTYSNSDKIATWQKTVDSINIKIILNGIMCDNFTIYEVKSGDSLNKIAKQFNTTIALIKRSNYLTKDVISGGQKLKIWNKKFSCFVDKSQNTLLLKSGDEVIKSYIVSTGANNCTPVGTFKIIDKIENPTWYKNGQAIPPQSPENILGSRWMGFNLKSYGIHGTTDPDNLGKQITQGCVRMRNSDVEELYIFLPVGTEVTIVD